MALNAQLTQIRRASSVLATAGSTKGLNIATGTTDKIFTTVVGNDFTVLGFTTGMRLTFNSTKNPDVYTAKTVAATVIELYEDLTTSENDTYLQLTGYAMTNIGEITGWTGPQDKVAVLDVTNLLSTAKEKMIAIKDSGQVTIDLFFDEESTMQQFVRKDITNKTLRNFDIMFNDSASLKSYIWFPGYISGFSVSGGVDTPIKANMTIEISGGAFYTTRR